jgi:two-component system, NtrC family, sensor histidine kinase KinB
MKIKTKLSSAFVFLFLVIVALGSVGAFYIYNLKSDASAVLKDNYKSIEAAGKMMESLKGIWDIEYTYFLDKSLDVQEKQYQQTCDLFEKWLKVEESNITEIGENQISSDLRKNYTQHIAIFRDAQRRQIKSTGFFFANLAPSYQVVYNNLNQVYEINMQAVLHKNHIVQGKAEKAAMYMEIIATIAILITLSFVYIFPGSVSGPLAELNLGIKQIALKNYNQKLDISTKDEFGELAGSFNNMVKRLQEYENSNIAKILFESRRTETIINNLKDAIIGLDESFHILFVNPEGCNLLELSRDVLIGKYAPDIATSNDIMREAIKGLLESTSQDNLFEESNIHITKGELSFYFSREILRVSTSKYKEEEALIIGYIIILKNITHFHELDQAKTNLIATVSHELKTPISSIKMSSKLLEDIRVGSMNEEQQMLVSNIKEEAQRLLKITSELLDMAQIETGKINLEIKAASMGELIEYACEALKMQLSVKNIQLIRENTEFLPKVLADSDKATWVIINLLNNAIRYSEENGQVIVKSGKRDKMAFLSITNYGQPIEAQYQEKIFEKFFKIPGNENKKGTGLGLAISKEFINAMKGDIWLESSQQSGTTFYLTLPVAETKQSWDSQEIE